MAKSGEEKTKPRGDPNASPEEKAKALEAARLQIEKQFGAGSLIKLGSHDLAAGIEVVPSGAITLDEALGIGGYPRGRIIEIFGPESSGKTTLALHAIAEAQRLGGSAAFIDAEHALDPVYAKGLGVNIDELWVSQPDDGEQAMEITDSLVRSGAMDVIVVDSVAALTPKAEILGDMGDAQMGAQARLMSQALRKLTATIGKSRAILVFINQIRMKIGVYMGNPETTTGGNALKFYSSVRIDVRKVEAIEESKNTPAIGNRVRVKVVKNKVAPPFRRTELELYFGKGISRVGSILDGAVKHEIIEKKGAWYSYGEERIGQGKDNARAYLEERPEFTLELESRLRKEIFPGREFPQAAKAAPRTEDAQKTAAAAAKTRAVAQATDVAASKTAEPRADGDDDVPARAPAAQAPSAAPTAQAPSAAAAQAPRPGPGRPRKPAPPSGQALSEDALF